MSFEFDIQSFIQPVLYILNKAEEPLDAHKIAKILYFADREHLAKYGTSITGDTYYKMQYGPVPSTVYDIIKAVQGKRSTISAEVVATFLAVNSERKITANRSFDEDEFSPSEIKCLDASIKEYADKSFDYLTDISHDSAWTFATDTMDELKIAEAGGADSGMLKYIKEHNELANASFY